MSKVLRIILWSVAGVPFVYLAIVWKRLPEKIATHFDLHGNADKYDNKQGVLLFMGIMLVVSIGIYLLLKNVYRIDPKRYAAENKGRLEKIAFAFIVFMAVLECMIIKTAMQGELMGNKLDVRFLFAAIGLFWAVLGNYMNNLKPNYFAGFRLPWTLENEDNWRYTHHIASKVWFAGGLLIAAVCLFTPKMFGVFAMIFVILVMVVVPIVFSYRYYNKQKSINSSK